MAKDEKNVARKEPNAVQRYISETRGELAKVTWPTWNDAKNLTIVVLIVTGVMSLFLGLLDLLFSRFFALILG